MGRKTMKQKYTGGEQAIVNNQFDIGKINADTLKETKPPKDRSGEDIASLKNHPGYVEIENYLLDRITFLENINIDGMTPELIGYQYALHKGIADEIKNLLNIVNANYEFQEEKRDRERTQD